MSFYANPNELASWCQQATFATVTHNKVRKELLDQLSSICKLSFKSLKLFKVSDSHLMAINTFLKKDGKGSYGETHAKDDELLNFTMTISTLIKQLNNFINNTNSEKHSEDFKESEVIFSTNTSPKKDEEDDKEPLVLNIKT